MYSNQAIIDQRTEEKEELKKVRIIMVSTIISYPLWGILSRYMAPEAYDPQWQRLACSFITLIVLFVTFKWKKAYQNLSWLYLVAWMYSYHLLYLYWKNADTAYYIICNLIQFPYVILCFPSKRDAKIYTFTKFVAIAILAYFLTYKNINPWFFVLAMITIGHYIITVLGKHFNIVESLKQAKKTFDLSLSNMLEGVLMINSKGMITSYNTSAMSLLGFTEHSHIEKLYKETPLYQNSVDEHGDRFKENGHPFDLALSSKEPKKSIILGIEGQDERQWLQINVQPLIDSENFLISFSDITDIRKNQQIRDHAQAQLAMNAKLSSLFKVAGGVAHEINNPLGVIITRLQILEKRLNDEPTEKSKESIQKTMKAAYRISNIVTTLLKLSSRADEEPVVKIKLQDVVEQALELNREHFRNYEIELIVDDIPDVSIKCRPVQIAQVFINLINNSFEAVMNQEYKWVRFSFRKNETTLFIEVSDSGPQISEEVKQKMMEPFFTTKDVGKGAGLGLSVSKTIIEAHSGSFYLSEDSINTSFVIELPLS